MEDDESNDDKTYCTDDRDRYKLLSYLAFLILPTARNFLIAYFKRMYGKPIIDFSMIWLTFGI